MTTLARIPLIRSVRPYRAGLVGGGVVCAGVLARVFALASDPSDRFIGAIPDDAFYYFQLAHNFAISRSWTFDGVAPATGFHPLYAYVLVALRDVVGDLQPRSWLILIGTLSAVALGAAATLTSATAIRLFGAGSVPLVVALFLTPSALVASTFLMETWMVPLFASATVFLVSGTTRLGPWRVIGMVTVGVFGSLARTDYVILPTALALGHLATRRAPGPRSGLHRATLMLSGAVLGLGFEALQNLVVSGSILQSSVRIKAFWTAMTNAHYDPTTRLPLSIDTPLRLLTSTVSPYTGFNPIVLYEVTLVVIASACLVVWSLLRGRRPTMLAGTLALVIGCLLSLLGFLLLYFVGWVGIQDWYVSNFIVPTALLVAATGRVLFDRRLPIAACAFAGTYVAVGMMHLADTPYPNQVVNLQAGRALRALPLQGPVGSWSAGIVGYVSGQRVVNLDGLVNDDAVPYILSNRLDDYLRERGIRYIADWGGMLDDPLYRQRGGYDGTRLISCLLPPRTIANTTVTWWGSSYHLWEIRPGCL